MKRAFLVVAVLAGVLAPAAAGTKPALDIDPNQVKFGKQVFGSLTVASFTITNQSQESLLVSIEQVQVGDDFSPGQPESTCTLTEERLLAPGESCTHVIVFQPSEFFEGREVATLRVSARDQSGAVVFSRQVRLTDTAVAPK